MSEFEELQIEKVDPTEEDKKRDRHIAAFNDAVELIQAEFPAWDGTAGGETIIFISLTDAANLIARAVVNANQETWNNILAILQDEV